MYYTVSLRLIVLPASTLRKIVITTASLVYDCFWPLLLIVEDWECFDFRPDSIFVQKSIKLSTTSLISLQANIVVNRSLRLLMSDRLT